MGESDPIKALKCMALYGTSECYKDKMPIGRIHPA